MSRRKKLLIALGFLATLGLGLVLGWTLGGLSAFTLCLRGPTAYGIKIPSSVTVAVSAYPRDEGVLVASVEEGSPAEKAGLRRGDIILSLGGEEVNTPQELCRLIREREPGEEVTLRVRRCEEELTLKATLGLRKRPTVQMWQEGRLIGWQQEEKAYLGVQLCEVPCEVFPAPVISVESGALVVEVEKGSPAEEAGLKEGDIIQFVGTSKIEPDNLPQVIRRHKIGDKVKLLVWRKKGREISGVEFLWATLGEHPDEKGVPYLGVRIAPPPSILEPPVPEEFGFEIFPPGVPLEFVPFPHTRVMVELIDYGFIVMGVAKGSPAQEAGLKEGDVITAIDGKKLKNLGTFHRLMREHRPGDRVTLTVLRKDEELKIAVTLGEHPERKGEAYLGVETYFFWSDPQWRPRIKVNVWSSLYEDLGPLH
jgi:S1-C subfamily serine protease